MMTSIALGLLALISGVVAWVIAGSGAGLAAIAGVGVAAFVSVSTQVAVLVGARFSPTALAGIVFGSFLVKVVVLLLILWAVSRSEMPRAAFVLTLVLGAAVALTIDTIVVVRARVPHVTPGRWKEAG